MEFNSAFKGLICSMLRALIRCIIFIKKTNKCTWYSMQSSSLCSIYHHSQTGTTIHHMYLLYTKLHRTTLQMTVFNCTYCILITVLSYNGNFNQNYMTFNCEVNPTQCKYMSFCSYHLEDVDMSGQTCQWLLCNKNIFITPKCTGWSFQ